MAQLARIEMHEERFENAAAIWQHLIKTILATAPQLMR